MEMQLLITVTAQGAVNVKGPIDNKLIAYGLLELAKEAIADHHRRLAATSIIPATSLPVGMKL